MSNDIAFSTEGASAVAWSKWWELPTTISTNAKTDNMAGRAFFPRGGVSSGAVRLLYRCQAEYGWDMQAAKRILLAYKDFLYALSFLPSDHWLVPCPLVHQIWELHICDTRHYSSDCQLLMGRIVHYNKYFETDDEDHDETEEESVHEKHTRRRKHKRQLLQKTMKFICEKTDQERLDPKVWNFGSSITADDLFHENKSEKAPRICSLSLKRNSSSLSNEDDEDNQECYGGGCKKKLRLNDNRSRSRPWNTLLAKAAPMSVQIQFTSNAKNCLEQKKEKSEKSITRDIDKENGRPSNSPKFQNFNIEKHVPLHRIFHEVARTQQLDRRCLQFTYCGQVLEGTETAHALSKYYGMKTRKTGGNDAADSKPIVGKIQRQSINETEVVLKMECSPVLSEC